MTKSPLDTDISTIPELKAYTQKIRAAAVAHNRDPSTIKIFAGIMPYLGKTLEEAQAKYDRAHALKSVNSGLIKFSGYTGIDLSQYPIDEPFTFEGKPADNTITGVINNLKTATDSDGVWTPRRLGELMALGGTTPAPVGTAEMVADVFEKFFRETDIDGFNIVCEYTPFFGSSPGNYVQASAILTPARCLESWKLRRCRGVVGARVAKAWYLLDGLSGCWRDFQGESSGQAWELVSGSYSSGSKAQKR